MKDMKKNNSNYGVYFEGIQKEAVKEISKSILSILNTSAGDTVKIAAINVLNKLGAGSNTISNCSIIMDKE